MPKKSMTPQSRKKTTRGRGDYTTEVTSIKNPITRLESKIDHLERSLVRNPLSKSQAASTIGRTLGNFIGQGDLGALAGSSLSKYFGHGDYTVKTNSLMKGASSMGAKFSGDGRRGTRVTEREYIGDLRCGSVIGNASIFNRDVYRINPTDAGTFPWLSQFAKQFDQWEPHGIVFEYVTTSSDFNGASQALGAVIMATDYDAYDPPYPTKLEMEAADYSCSTKPSLNLVHGIECEPKERPFPILYTTPRSNAPEALSSLGNFQVATQGCSVSSVTLGELWVSYDITFYKKQLADRYDHVTNVAGNVLNGIIVPGTFTKKAQGQIVFDETTKKFLVNNRGAEKQRWWGRIRINGPQAEDLGWAVNPTIERMTVAAGFSMLVVGENSSYEFIFETTAPEATITWPPNPGGDNYIDVLFVRVPPGLAI